MNLIALTAAATMTLGVQTHFSQGWGAGLVDRLAVVGAPAIRDSVPWTSGEKNGAYDFTGPRIAPLRAACARGADLLLTIVPKHPDHDGGRVATTPEAQKAYADYVAALVDALPGCIAAIEIGNELNGGKGIESLPGSDPAATYVSLVRATAAVVKPRHPKVALLGGSTNLIGTGFLDRLFAAGLLDAADGIVVHPYRRRAEGIDIELAHLRATMRRHGRERPIWATEFGDYYETAEAAASEQVKAVSLMSAAGVERAYWYALIDQSFFPNMGLFAGSTEKPAAESFRTIQRRLLPAGRATRIDTGDRRTFLFRYGADNWVVWGAPRPIRFAGSPRYHDARGREIAAPAAIGFEPLIVTGAGDYSLGAGPVLADSLLEQGGLPWSYHARIGNAAPVPMTMQDTTFESRWGLDARGPLRLTGVGGSPAGDAARPQRAVLRYTAPAAQTVKVVACLSKGDSGDGVGLSIRQNGRALHEAVLTRRLEIDDVTAMLDAGEALDFEIGPNVTAGGDSFSWRIQLVDPAASIAPACP